MPRHSSLTRTYNQAETEALKCLFLSGFRLVLLRPFPDLTPCWRRYQHGRLQWSTVQTHVLQGGMVGAMPWQSGRFTVLDVDQGRPETVMAAFPPFAICVSKTPGRRHLWYRDRAPRKNHNKGWAYRGCTGDVRSRKGGFVVLYEPGPLAKAVENGPERPDVKFPQQLLLDGFDGPQDGGNRGFGPPTGLRPTAFGFEPGSRNASLLCAIASFVMPWDRGQLLDDWWERVRDCGHWVAYETITDWEDFTPAEVDKVARNACEWTWTRKPHPKHPYASKNVWVQKWRNRRSITARRAAVEGRNEDILKLHGVGLSQRQIAAKIGVSQRTAGRAILASQRLG